jgi:hypothetical protein
MINDNKNKEKKRTRYRNRIKEERSKLLLRKKKGAIIVVGGHLQGVEAPILLSQWVWCLVERPWQPNSINIYMRVTWKKHKTSMVEAVNETRITRNLTLYPYIQCKKMHANAHEPSSSTASFHFW